MCATLTVYSKSCHSQCGVWSIMQWLAEFVNVGHSYGEIAFFLFWQGSCRKLIWFLYLKYIRANLCFQML